MFLCRKLQTTERELRGRQGVSKRCAQRPRMTDAAQLFDQPVKTSKHPGTAATDKRQAHCSVLNKLCVDFEPSENACCTMQVQSHLFVWANWSALLCCSLCVRQASGTAFCKRALFRTPTGYILILAWEMLFRKQRADRTMATKSCIVQLSVWFTSPTEFHLRILAPIGLLSRFTCFNFHDRFLKFMLCGCLIAGITKFNSTSTEMDYTPFFGSRSPRC